MAKDSTVNSAAQNISNSIQNAANSVNSGMQDTVTAINGAIANLGDGLKLTVKNSSKAPTKESTNADFAKLKAQLDGLRVFCPELAEITETLIDINTELLSSSLGIKDTETLEAEEQQEADQASDIKTDATSSSDLAGLTSLVSITGTGFSIVGNALNSLVDLFSTVLEGIAPGQLSQVLIANNAGATIDSKAEDAENSKGKGNLAEFFKGLAGPLESVASGMLLLSISMAVLSAVDFSSDLVGKVILLQTFMLTTFAIVAAIDLAFMQVQKYFDPEGKNQGSVLYIVKQFATMLLLSSGTLLLSALLVDIITENWSKILTGMIVIFGAVFVTMASLSITSNLISTLTGEDSDISKMVKSFAAMVITIAGLAVFCAVLYDVILEGMSLAVGILAVTTIALLTLSLSISQIDLTSEQLTAFSSIMKMMIALVGIIAVFTVVLGLIPQSIVLQGLMTVTTITLLVDSMIALLTRSITKIENVSQESLDSLKAILITATVLVGILGILVIVLGAIDPMQLVQGITAVTVLTALPIVMIKLLSKVAEQSSQMVQALEGIAIASLVSVAVAGLAWLLIRILGGFTVEQVGVTMLTMTLMVTMIAVVTLAIAGIGALAAALITGPQAALIPLSFAGIAIAGAVSIAIAGLARLLAVILPEEQAHSAILAASAIMMVTAALVVVGSSIVLLGGLAIPMLAASSLALIAVNIISKFLKTFAVTLASTLEFVSGIFASLDVEQLKVATGAIAETIQAFIGLSTSLLTFNGIAAILTLQLTLASASMLLVNTGLIAFMFNYKIFTGMLSSLPTNPINLSGLTNTISSLNEFSAAIENFTAPTLTKLAAVSTTMTFVESFAKKLSKVGTDDNINKVNNLATSLSALAQNAGGLSDLAIAIRAVADATKDLNTANEASKISIEALSGQVGLQATELQRLEKPKEVEDTSKLDAIAEQLNSAVSTLRDLAEGVRDLIKNTGRMAETQEFESQQARARYISG